MTRELSNSHAKRANRSAGARPLPDFYDDSGLPKRRIPSELEPATFAHRVGIKGDHDDATLKSAQFAYNRMSLALDDIYKRERTILADSSQTPENHKLRVSKMLDKVFDSPADAVEQARAQMPFQMCNPLADSGLGEPGFLGCGGEAAKTRRSLEGADPFQRR